MLGCEPSGRQLMSTLPEFQKVRIVSFYRLRGYLAHSAVLPEQYMRQLAGRGKPG